MSHTGTQSTPPGTAARGTKRFWPMAAILLAAAGLRFYGINFGLPALLDPDELIFVGGAHQLYASGNFNPGWFGHPATTTIYVVGIVAGLVLGAGLAAGAFASPDAFAQALFLNPGIVVLPTRIVMACFGVACVALTARLAIRLGGGRTAGLVAGGLMAMNPVQVAWSQVIRSDMMALAFLLLAALASLSLLEHGKWRDHLLACLYTALAMTSKWPFAVAFLSLLGALALRRWSKDRALAVSSAGFARKAVTAGALVFVFVLAISPYLLLDFSTLISNLEGEAKVAHLGGASGGPFANLVYYLTDPLYRGVGPLGAVLSITGLYILRRHLRFWAMVGIPAAALLVVVLTQAVVWERWAIPFAPPISIAAGFGAEWIAARFKARPPSIRSICSLAFGAALFAPVLWATYTRANERISDSRRIATDWARAHLPPGTSMMVEHFAFDLVDSPFEVMFPIGTAGCLDARKVLRGQISYKQIDALRGGHSNLDYAAVPEAKQFTCRADVAILTEHARYAAEQDRFPVEASRYRDLIAEGRVVARFRASPGRVGGRPEIIVLKLRHSPHRSEPAS